jgi:hypothetical protein
MGAAPTARGHVVTDEARHVHFGVVAELLEDRRA